NCGPVPRHTGFHESPAHGRNSHIEVLRDLTPGESRLPHRADAFHIERDLSAVHRTRPTDLRGDLRDFGTRKRIHLAVRIAFKSYESCSNLVPRWYLFGSAFVRDSFRV